MKEDIYLGSKYKTTSLNSNANNMLLKMKIMYETISSTQAGFRNKVAHETTYST